jgi:hypothetical protein
MSRTRTSALPMMNASLYRMHMQMHMHLLHGSTVHAAVHAVAAIIRLFRPGPLLICHWAPF